MRPNCLRGTCMRMLPAVALTSALLLAAGCAPQTVSNAEGALSDTGANAVSAPAEWSPDIDCSTCHTAESSSADDAATLMGFHGSVASDVTCSSCHADSAALTEVHEGKMDGSGRLPKKLKKTSVSGESCAQSGCHDMQEIVGATAESTALTDDNGNVVNPHAMLNDEAHEVGGSNGANVTCDSCHSMHGESTSDVETMTSDAQDFCKSCHHQNVYECGTCHE